MPSEWCKLNEEQTLKDGIPPITWNSQCRPVRTPRFCATSRSLEEQHRVTHGFYFSCIWINMFPLRVALQIHSISSWLRKRPFGDEKILCHFWKQRNSSRDRAVSKTPTTASQQVGSSWCIISSRYGGIRPLFKTHVMSSCHPNWRKLDCHLKLWFHQSSPGFQTETWCRWYG